VDARLVVCADGAKGTTARQLDIEVKKDVALGIANLVQKPAGWRRGDDEVQLILGLAHDTYGWVFPRDKYLSVGIECHDRRVDWRAAVDRLFRHLWLEDASITAECMHPIPSLRKPYKLTENRSMVVGDAAGLCDPLTGEGIRNALLSARLAADVLAAEVRCAEPDISAYEQQVRKCLIPEIESGGRLLAAVKLLGTSMLPGLRDENRIGHGCARLLRGETTYTGLLSSALGMSGIVRILGEGFECPKSDTLNWVPF
ncbi:MAG: NAD(P)/FAD-dependent oxidoreductase, partial [Dehalococcoidia bacterium]|nr:NAD(P)/FAD-dependent oxidoreductase [Dehalococcoidia bacterium]